MIQLSFEAASLCHNRNCNGNSNGTLFIQMIKGNYSSCAWWSLCCPI